MLIFAWCLILIVQGLTLAQLITLRARLRKAIAFTLARENLVPVLVEARENGSARMVVAPAPPLIKVPARTAPMAASQAG